MTWCLTGKDWLTGKDFNQKHIIRNQAVNDLCICYWEKCKNWTKMFCCYVATPIVILCWSAQCQLNDQDELTAFRPQFPWYLVVSLQWRLYVHSGYLQTLQTTSDTKSFTNLTARLFQRRDCADHGGAQQQWGWDCVFYLLKTKLDKTKKK